MNMKKSWSYAKTKQQINSMLQTADTSVNHLRKK